MARCAEARFAASYFRLGLSPDGGSTHLLPQLIGEQRSRRFFFENEVIGADEAHRIGLADQVAPADRLIPMSTDLCRRWASWALHSRTSTKRLLDSQSHQDLSTQLHDERRLIVDATSTEDFAEGVTAFLEKRRPDFR